MSQSFAPVTEKFYLKSLDDGTTVKAQYNPKELQIDRTVPWGPPAETGKANSNAKDQKAKKSGGVNLEFTGAKGRSLTVELLFDAVEGTGGPYGVNLAEQVGALEHLAQVRKPNSAKEDDRRPHWCVATWGTALQGFRCVIESVSTKYTMFNEKGEPLRATCTVKLTEADSVSTAKEKKA